MSFLFEPQSESEILNLIPDGVYDFKIASAEDAISKKTGKPMIKMSVIVWDSKGKEHYLIDYIMPSFMFKLKHFCDAAGLTEKYESGSLSAADCNDKAGKCKIITNPESDFFPPQNAIKDYVKSKKVVSIASNASSKTVSSTGNKADEAIFKDDDLLGLDIPF